MRRIAVFWMKYRISRACASQGWWSSVKWAWRFSDPNAGRRWLETLGK